MVDLPRYNPISTFLMENSNAVTAALYINGFNALDNVWIGGDIQGHTKDGIYLLNSTLKEIGVSFEPGG